CALIDGLGTKNTPGRMERVRAPAQGSGEHDVLLELIGVGHNVILTRREALAGPGVLFVLGLLFGRSLLGSGLLCSRLLRGGRGVPSGDVLLDSTLDLQVAAAAYERLLGALHS